MLLLALLWAGMLVLWLAGSMMAEGAPRRAPGRRVLVSVAVLSAAALFFDQYLHGFL